MKEMTAAGVKRNNTSTYYTYIARASKDDIFMCLSAGPERQDFYLNCPLFILSTALGPTRKSYIETDVLVSFCLKMTPVPIY
jgi:hypothetical protein